MSKIKHLQHDGARVGYRDDGEGRPLVLVHGTEERYALAFSDLSALRVAIDQELTDFDAPLDGAREVAFFPPMTGG